MAQKQHQMHGRDHAPGGSDPIPGAGHGSTVNLPTIKGVYQVVEAPSNDFFIGQESQGDDATWLYHYNLPDRAADAGSLLLVDPGTGYISTPITGDGGTPLWLVVISARLEGISASDGGEADASIEPYDPQSFATADQLEHRWSVHQTAYLQRSYLTGGPPPSRLRVSYDIDSPLAAPVNATLSVTLIHAGPVYEVPPA